MSAAVKRVLRAALHHSPLPEMLLRRRASRALTILAYHRIGPLPTPDYPFDEALVSADEEEFAREIRYCRRHMDVISMPELVNGLELLRSGNDQRGLPERPAIITFDDGYLDNLTCALPVLRQENVSACFFLCTHIVGTNKIPWWDQIACCFKNSRAAVFASPFGSSDPAYRCDQEHLAVDRARFLDNIKAIQWDCALQCLEDLREKTGVVPEEYLDRPLFLTWDEARQLVAQGMSVGGHTRTHPILSQVDTMTLEAEVGGCTADLMANMAQQPFAFAYPVGGNAMMSCEADAAIERAGYRLSFSYRHGFANRLPNSLWRLPRLHAEYGQDFSAFRLETARAPLLQN